MAAVDTAIAVGVADAVIPAAAVVSVLRHWC